jgi:DNA-binding NarL/FixJ family response regulator
MTVMNDRDARMLIIDDDVAALDELADYFTRQGFRVDTAVRADDARQSLSERAPDLVLLAVSAPAEVEALRCVRGASPAVPVILLRERSEPALAHATRASSALRSLPTSMVEPHAGLTRLVAQHIEALEPGLRIIESRFPVERASVDFVALDARNSLVLVVVGRAADSGTFLRAAQVYWWCREHPDLVRGLFPAARIAPDQPLRLLFVAQRFTPLFVRALEQLRLADVRCLRYQDMAADGIAAVPLGEADALWARGAPLQTSRARPTSA